MFMYFIDYYVNFLQYLVNDQTLSRHLLLLEPRSFSTLNDVDYTFFSDTKLHYVTWKIYIAERRFKGFSISNT
jgi:hypothetical protein